jgi:hypothetical protein
MYLARVCAQSTARHDWKLVAIDLPRHLITGIVDAASLCCWFAHYESMIVDKPTERWRRAWCMWAACKLGGMGGMGVPTRWAKAVELEKVYLELNIGNYWQTL